MNRLKKLRQSWPILALMMFYVYLAFHALNGNQGLTSWVTYEQDIHHLRAKLKNLKQTREKLEIRADALRTSHLDLDALDIVAREQVFLAHPDDLTLWVADMNFHKHHIASTPSTRP